MIFRRGFLKGLVAALFAPKIVRAESLFRGNQRDIYPDGWVEHPMTLTRIPVMLDGVVRYLKSDDPRLFEGAPLPEHDLAERHRNGELVPMDTEEWIKSRGEMLEKGFKEPLPRSVVRDPYKLVDLIAWRSPT